MGLTVQPTPVLVGQQYPYSAANPLGIKNWTQYFSASNSTSPGYSTAAYSRIQYAGGYYFFCDNNGYIYYSTDAKSWSVTAITGNPSLNDMTYGNGVFVAVGANNVLYSATTPGGTWTARTSQFAGTDTIYNVRWIPSASIFVICGQGATSPYNCVSSSPDGITWTARYNAGGYLIAYNISVDDTTATTTIGISTNASTAANFLYSTNGTTWNTTNAANSAQSSWTQFIKGALNKWIVQASGNFYTSTTSAIATAWATSPYIQFTSASNLSQMNGSSPTGSSFGLYEWYYDSTNNLYYALSIGYSTTNIENWPLLHTYDASKVITAYNNAGSYSYVVFPLLKTETLPAPFTGRQSTGNSSNYGFVNGIHIYTTNNTRDSYRHIYTTA